jgi:hypothetical protein
MLRQKGRQALANAAAVEKKYFANVLFKRALWSKCVIFTPWLYHLLIRKFTVFIILILIFKIKNYFQK